MLRASIRREKRSCLKQRSSFSPLPFIISQKAWQSEWPLELWLVIQVQKPLSGRLAWPLGLACKISQLSIPIRTVEPIGALLGAVAVLSMTAILPYALSFAAGAMIFVVVEELIPDSQTNGNTDVATLGLMVGFVIMMILDVALG